MSLIEQSIVYQSGNRQIDGYLARPEGEGEFPGIIVNHEGIRDLKAGLSYLAEHPRLDSERIGAIGFCMGGGLAIAWACTDNRLKAIAPFYGANPRPLKAVERMCPVVGSYPDKDFTTSHAKKLDVELEHYHIPHDIKICPD